MSHLGLFFLGPPEIYLDSQPVPLPTRKAIALLAYLSVTGKPHSRDSLAALLWPDSGQAQARASLRQALWTLKEAGLSGWLETGQEMITLKPSYDLDVMTFQNMVANFQVHVHPPNTACMECIGLLSQAVDLYRGDFLTGFTLRDSPEFDNWQSFHAESLRLALSAALERLIGLLYTSGELEQAIRYARRWLALDTLHEPAHRWLMQLYALAGNRALALHQYENLREILSHELGVEPEEDSQELYEKIRDNHNDSSIVQSRRINSQPTRVSPLPGSPGRETFRNQVVPAKRGLFTGTDNGTILARISHVPLKTKSRAELGILLNQVRNFWIEGVLKNSIHGAVLLDLGKRYDYEAVEHPWGMVLEIPNRQGETISRNTRMVDIFDQTNRALLILGAPGSGKTTTLIELARDLIELAESDGSVNQPVPVIFNLSSWAEHRPSLIDWMVEELSKKYHIPRRTGKLWLEENRLVLLLDGLDEVESKHRAACIEAINAFIETYGVAGLAICSRIEQYTEMPIRLRLYGAVRLLPLSLEQVEDYLTNAGVGFKDLIPVLKMDESLHEFIRTPLVLNIIALAYTGLNAETLFSSKNTDTVEQLRNRLFDSYVERMLERKGKSSSPYQADQIKIWLAKLANGMVKHKQTIFLIEDFQPSWLMDKKQRLGYFMSSRVIGSLIFIMGFALRGILRNNLIDTLLLVVGGVMSGLAIGFIDGLHFEQSFSFPENKKISEPWGIVFRFLLVTILGGVIFGVFDTTSQILFHPLLGVTFGSVFGLWKNQQSISQDIQTVESTGFSWRGALKGMVLGLLTVAFYFLMISLQQRFLPSAGPSGILNRVDVLSVGLGVIFGSLGGAILGGMNSSKIVIKTSPNQGIHLSLKKAIFPGLILGFLFGLVWALLEHSYENLYTLLGYERFTPYETYNWVFYLITALLFGSTLFLRFGGFDGIKHYTLRLFLTYTHLTPWQSARFLNIASNHLLLQKVGGGFSFIHRYLMEHFAESGEKADFIRT